MDKVLTQDSPAPVNKGIELTRFVAANANFSHTAGYGLECKSHDMNESTCINKSMMPEYEWCGEPWCWTLNGNCPGAKPSTVIDAFNAKFEPVAIRAGISDPILLDTKIYYTYAHCGGVDYYDMGRLGWGQPSAAAERSAA